MENLRSTVSNKNQQQDSQDKDLKKVSRSWKPNVYMFQLSTKFTSDAHCTVFESYKVWMISGLPVEGRSHVSLNCSAVQKLLIDLNECENKV